VWLALLVALALAGATARALRRHAAQATGAERDREAWRRFFRHRVAVWGIGVLAFFVIVAVAAPLVTPYDPWAQLDIIGLKNRPPSLRFPLGTDVYSRDVWSRIVFGARVSLTVGALAMLVAVALGTLVGAVAGYYRRWVDAVLMRGVDVGLALPRIFILLMAVALWDRLPLAVLVLAMGLTSWFGTSRLVRAEVLSLRERDFVAAARALGAGPARVILGHVLPNAAAPIIVSAALGIGNVLLLEAGLSFLGIGVAPPTPSWGNMIADGAQHLATAPWTTLFPGLAIALVVMALNAVGDALRDALDPRAEVT
jgi:peptide/nickel transport system permease protein